ncbi:Regulatory-associated protein of TOR 1 [Apostasia shenzhenica]|uniref:Regulatory-associated protein of TOR 1 n=1 Tax=Apostasia shenzhenica TaxID=1088818 RepID=A0A2I0A4V9_9ASPA|nr:Regulatory-associated protein of TOR 1 [Apostasia shenzhenica]
MTSRFSQSSASVSSHLDEFSGREDADSIGQGRESELAAGVNSATAATATSLAYLPQTVFLCDSRHEDFENCVPLGPSDSGLVSKWRPKDRGAVGIPVGPIEFQLFFERRDYLRLMLSIVIKKHEKLREEYYQSPWAVTDVRNHPLSLLSASLSSRSSRTGESAGAKRSVRFTGGRAAAGRSRRCRPCAGIERRSWATTGQPPLSAQDPPTIGGEREAPLSFLQIPAHGRRCAAAGPAGGCATSSAGFEQREAAAPSSPMSVSLSIPAHEQQRRDPPAAARPPVSRTRHLGPAASPVRDDREERDAESREMVISNVFITIHDNGCIIECFYGCKVPFQSLFALIFPFMFDVIIISTYRGKNSVFDVSVLEVEIADPFSMTAPKALDTIGKSLHAQYERWQPRARYRLQLDPTVEEVKKLCSSCRKNARSERVLFHYNGHGVPKPTANGEIWVFNKPQECNASGASGSSKDCILLAACEAHETLPQSAEFPADVFTSCLTTPIKMALRWFCSRSLLHDSIDHSLVDKIPGRQNDRKTLLGELNWIFTAVTDTIAWNVLPHDLFQRLFRQDLLVASLFRNFLLAERIMRTANCSPRSYPQLPLTHQHHMWDAWDMAAEICLSKLPQLIADPNAEFQLTAFEVWLDHGSEHKKPPEQLPIVLQVLLSQSHRFRALVLLGRFLDMGSWAVDLALSVGIFPYVLKLLQTTALELRQILVFIWTKILALDKVDLVKDGGHSYFIKFLDSMDAYAEQRAMAAFILAVIVDGHRRGQEACIQANLIHVCLRHLQLANPHEFQTEPLLLQWLCLCLGKLWEDYREAQLIGLQAGAPAIFLPLLSEPQPEVRAAAVFALGTLLEVGSNSFRDGHGGDEDIDEDEQTKADVCVVKSLLQVLGDGSPLVRAEIAVEEENGLEVAGQARRHGRRTEKLAESVGRGHDWVRQERPNDAKPRVARRDAASTEIAESVRSNSCHGSRGMLLVSFQIVNSGWVAAALARFGFGHNKYLKSIAAAYWKPHPSSVLSSLPSLANIGSAISGCTSSKQYMHQGSSFASQIGPVLRVGSDCMASSRDGRISTSSPIASTGIMHGSPVSDDSSQHSDSGILLKESTSNGVIGHPRTRPLDSAVYSQCVLAMSTLAKDPSPRIASLGRRALAIIGIERVVQKAAKYNGTGVNQGDVSAQAASPCFVGLARSSSWFDMHAGHLPMTFRTPPVSPPKQNYLAGLRRVYSLEFRPHQLGSPDSGLADPVLASTANGTSERSLLPQSTIYNWSCGHFSRPLLTASIDNEEIMARREEREKNALDRIAKCQHSSVSKLSNQIASWDTRFETGTKATLLLPFTPIVVAADENERIRVWNYEEGTPLNSFDNHSAPDTGVSKLCLMNELDDNLLLVASFDGNIRIWKDYTLKGSQKLVTAFSSIQGHRAGVRASNVVVDWQQQSGYLYASGDISSILLWDLDKEQNVSAISSSSDSGVSALPPRLATLLSAVDFFAMGTTLVMRCLLPPLINTAVWSLMMKLALSASQVHGGQFAAGFVDGSVRIFDIRTPDIPVCATRLHTQRVEKVVGIGFQPGFDPTKIVSASQAGDIQFLDVRNYSEAYLTIDAHRGSLTALAIHRHAPVIASGSAKQIVKVFSLEGEQLSIIRYYPTFMAQRIGSVSCLIFHPYRVLLAAGAADACVSIYADDNYQAR